MKILFAIKTLDASKGGAEKVLADVTSGLAEKSHKISVLSFDAPGGQAHYPLHQKVHRITLGVGNVARRATLKTLQGQMVGIYVTEPEPEICKKNNCAFIQNNRILSTRLEKKNDFNPKRRRHNQYKTEKTR